MPNDGTFREQLPCGGSLCVSNAQQGISYSYPGPDRRYSWTHFFLSAEILQETADALKENFKDYEKIKQVLPAGAEFTKTGKLNMVIRTGLAYPGVWIRPYHLGAGNSESVQRIAESYAYALERIKQLKPLLNSI